MKLSKREETMIIGLLVIISAYFAYAKLYLPKIELLQLQRKTLSGNMEIKLRLGKNMLKGGQLEEKAKAMKLIAEELGQSLPGSVCQENVILYIDDVFSRNGIGISSVRFSESGESRTGYAESRSIEDEIEDYMEYLENDDNIDFKKYFQLGEGEKSDETNDAKGEETQKKYKTMGVDISFSGLYSDFKAVLTEIEQSKRKIIIKKISINNTVGDIAGTMSLEFPFYPESK